MFCWDPDGSVNWTNTGLVADQNRAIYGLRTSGSSSFSAAVKRAGYRKVSQWFLQNPTRTRFWSEEGTVQQKRSDFFCQIKQKTKSSDEILTVQMENQRNVSMSEPEPEPSSCKFNLNFPPRRFQVTRVWSGPAEPWHGSDCGPVQQNLQMSYRFTYKSFIESKSQNPWFIFIMMIFNVLCVSDESEYRNVSSVNKI